LYDRLEQQKSFILIMAMVITLRYEQAHKHDIK